MARELGKYEYETRTVAVVGAGPVGALAAIYFANRGWNVELYEARPDMRIAENKAKIQNRSINLALSARGLSALKSTGLGLDKYVLQSGLPMKGRMLHIGEKGKLVSQNYGVHGECINSVDRAKLNEDLITAAEKLPNVKVVFNHSLKRADFDKGTLHLENKETNQKVHATADLIIGCDGAYSSVRNSLMRHVRVDFEQNYLAHGYCELNIPAKINNKGEKEFAMDPHHLHIWPRHHFMMIALPNPDKTFTVTLFMPFENFESIHNKDDLLAFFRLHFADAIPLMGEEALARDYFRNPKGSLIRIKANPYHYKDRGIILGDAAHSMVPFYGQGMNCGFEDVEYLDRLLDEHEVMCVKPKNPNNNDLARALQAFTDRRAKDIQAICDLALYNYEEMRHGVTSPLYIMRKKVETALNLVLPKTVVPLYTMVSFSTRPYSRALEQHQRQGFWLAAAGISLSIGAVAGLAVVGLKHTRDLREAKDAVRASLETLARKVALKN
ncbi:kynurenine 3-monooxygenase, mitochondrial precursor [Actinomortierella ambigua]|uniref:Kynurenine 3-monooxygenase n=1 Tax=Actinomortierella ambigua TaxID=1343610 RepID=A0A9P6U7M0_9FUNG|nr:kynurenine 3-monooxygenase, mitochondrial precursor [Actinomortierella ambigua]